MGMFSRRKLFQLVGLGSAAVVSSRLPTLASSGPNQIEMLMAVKRELDNNPMSMLAAQQEINRRRSEVIRQYVKFNKFGPYKPE